MQILAVDVGTGTQDVLLYDSTRELENCFKLVLPSPTMQVARRIRAATQAGRPVVLEGVTMGGGPSQWAARDHVLAGLPLYATPDAARTFNDELDVVERVMGIRVVGADEAIALAARDDTERLFLRDFDFEALALACAAAGIVLAPDGLAIAAFDHGNAPPGTSDRQFRFDLLKERLTPPSLPPSQAGGDAGEAQLARFAYRAAEVPETLTRLAAIAGTLRFDPDLAILMDSAPAAVLGARFDPHVAELAHSLVVNIGKFHTLAFRLGPDGIEGLFEHHTGEIDKRRLERLLLRLAAGTLKHAEVFDDQGHGALILRKGRIDLRAADTGVAVVGPRRSLLHGSRLCPYFAVPFGDMMLAGCFGLLRAYAELVPGAREAIEASLAGTPRGAPWDTPA